MPRSSPPPNPPPLFPSFSPCSRVLLLTRCWLLRSACRPRHLPPVLDQLFRVVGQPLHFVVTALPVLEVSGSTPLAMMAPIALLMSSSAGRSRLWLITWPGRMRGISGHLQAVAGLGSIGSSPSVILSPGQAGLFTPSYSSSIFSFSSGKSRIVHFSTTPVLAEELFEMTQVILTQKLPMPSYS